MHSREEKIIIEWNRNNCFIGFLEFLEGIRVEIEF